MNYSHLTVFHQFYQTRTWIFGKGVIGVVKTYSHLNNDNGNGNGNGNDYANVNFDRVM